jgi:hypothetical protein
MNEHVQLMVTYISLYPVTSLPRVAIYRCTLHAITKGVIATM